MEFILMKRAAIAIFVCIAFTVSAFPNSAVGALEIGSKLENFSLNDTRGKSHNIKDLKGENGVLIVFLSAQCPVVAMYNDRINALATEYKAQGINFVGLYPNATECLNWVKHHSGTYKFTTLVDENNVIADKFGAQYTPEVFYFGAGDTLDYHGAIDNDRYGRNIEIKYLDTAFQEKLAGKEITQKDTKAFGCSIKRVGDD